MYGPGVFCYRNAMTSEGLVFLFKKGEKEVEDDERGSCSFVSTYAQMRLCPSCFRSDPRLRLSLSSSLTSLTLFLSTLPLSSHLDLIDGGNSPSARKDSVCMYEAWQTEI